MSDQTHHLDKAFYDHGTHTTKIALYDCFVFLGVLEEARFFGISKAVEPLELMVQSEELALSGHFTRKEFLRMLSITSSSATLRCQVRVGGRRERERKRYLKMKFPIWHRVSTLRESIYRTLTFVTSTSSVPTFATAISLTVTSPTASLSEQTCTMPILM